MNKAFFKRMEDYININYKNYFMNGFVAGVQYARKNPPSEKGLEDIVDIDFLKKQFDKAEDTSVEYIPHKPTDKA